jgi:hypothetical protein
MKRHYRPFRDDHYLVPIEVIDFWIIFLFVVGLLCYLAWRYT